MASNENNLAAYNAVEVALGGAGGHLNDMAAVRAIAVLEGVSGGPVDVSEDNMALRLNAIDIGAGGVGMFFNTLDALNSIVVLKGGLGGHQNDLDAINEWVDVALVYLLRATFDAADQGYADAQVLNTLAEGIAAGQLTVVEVDGTLAIVSNRCAFTAQGTPVFTDLGFFSQAIAKALGRTLLGTLNLTTWEELGVAWHDAGAVVDPDNTKFAIQANTVDGQFDTEMGTQIVSGLSLSTDYKFALVMGGYDVNGVPWRTGEAAASYLFGAAYYFHNGTEWVLLWRNESDNTATLFAVLSVLDGAGTLDDFRVPDRDLSAVLQPSHLSTFTAANGTSLDAITPEIGSSWVEDTGDYDIQGNEANNVTAGTSLAQVPVAGLADGIYRCRVTPVASLGAGPLFRWSDNTHYWFAYINNSSNSISLFEVNPGFTSRGSASVTIVAGVEYEIIVIVDGTSIAIFLDGANRVAFTSSFNQTQAVVGLYAEASGVTFNDFAVFPRTDATYDTEFDAV